ncbi:MAG: M23 family metallopeptidase [Chloroflexi bacterium]|nr:M23 family metallopeptidase [Chloroflexota bacterium]
MRPIWFRLPFPGLLLLAVLGWLALAACSGAQGQPADGQGQASPATTPAGDGGRNTPGAPNPTANPQAARDEPVGFPLPLNVRPMRVVETGQGRAVVPAAPDGPTVLEVARDYQPRQANDMEANRYGWNCRLHDSYEGAPGVDWYLPAGTPVIATMRGDAELYVVTTANSFAYYGVPTDIMLGLPPPTTARYPLPGPSGGMGVFVSVLNGSLRAEYGHLDLGATLPLVPRNAFVQPHSPTFAFDATFSRPRNFDQYTLVARWPVQRGDTVGRVGNTGYSDVPHLHYQIMNAERTTKYCPTRERFPGAGWLFQRPVDLP